MDLEAAKFVFNVLQFLLTGGIGIYVYISNKQRVTRERVETVASEINQKLDKMGTETDSRLDDHSGRITRVEETIRHLPVDDDLQNIREVVATARATVEGLKAEVDGLRALMKPMQRTIELVHEYLLNQKP